MKRRKTLKILFVATLILILGGYLYLKFSWLTLYSFNEMKHNARIVDSSISPPINFLKVWDKLYPNSRNNGMSNQLWSDLTRTFGNKNYSNCECDEIGYFAWDNPNHHFKFILKRGLENIAVSAMAFNGTRHPQNVLIFG